MSEHRISDEIRACYERDGRIPHPAGIAVAERNGQVTLRGTVASLSQLRAAVDIAKSVRGVRHVDNALALDPRERVVDDEIKGAALQALISNPDVPDDQIDVRVRAGWVALNGTVRHQHQSDAAFEAVSRVGGIGGITNRIVVVAPGGH